MNKKSLFVLLFCLITGTGWAANDNLKPRLVVCTDIAPADVEPDDMESMVRLMAYADCFELRSLPFRVAAVSVSRDYCLWQRCA